jgi:hypothetical protein
MIRQYEPYFKLRFQTARETWPMIATISSLRPVASDLEKTMIDLTIT